MATDVPEASFTDDLIGIIKNSNLYFFDPRLNFVQVHIASNISKISIYDRKNLLAIGHDPSLVSKVIRELMNRAKMPRSYMQITDYDKKEFVKTLMNKNYQPWVTKYSSNVYGLLNLFKDHTDMTELFELVDLNLNESSDVFTSYECSTSTALNWTISGGTVKSVSYLLQKGANPWLRDMTGTNAFEALLCDCGGYLFDPTPVESILKLFDNIPTIYVRSHLYEHLKQKFAASPYILSRIGVE